jgi:hypothetical protein
LSLPDTDHIALGPGRPQQRPLCTTAVVIYGTLALLALAVPRGLVNWSVSQQIGADWPYRRGRAIFLNATGKREE